MAGRQRSCRKACLVAFYTKKYSSYENLFVANGYLYDEKMFAFG